MAFSRTGLLLLGVLALSGCDKIGGGPVAPSPSAVPSQALAALPSATPTASPSPAPTTQTIEFGDDSGKWAKDGECDDPRFGGPGMTDTPLLDADIKHDAADCRAAFNQGRLTYKGETPSAPPSGYAASGVDHIIWGDDSGKYARDGECDDKRFNGPGMTDTPLLDSDIKHDATDCRVAFSQGRLTLRE